MLGLLGKQIPKRRMHYGHLSRICRVGSGSAWKRPNNIITYIQLNGCKHFHPYMTMCVHHDGRTFAVEILHAASYNFLRHAPLGCCRVRLRVAWKLPTVKGPRVRPGALFWLVTRSGRARPGSVRHWGALAMTRVPCPLSPLGVFERCPKRGAGWVGGRTPLWRHYSSVRHPLNRSVGIVSWVKTPTMRILLFLSTLK